MLIWRSQFSMGVERFRQLGLPVRVLGPAQEYWGEERYPLFLDGVELAHALESKPRLTL